MQEQDKIQFILFLDPVSGQFYSYSASRGLIVRQDEREVPKRIINAAKQQIEELKICMEGASVLSALSSFQKRPIPLNLLTQRKFKYPVYSTEQTLPASSLQNFKQSQKSPKQSLNDYISAVIDVTELRPQLQRSKKGKPSDFLTIDIKLITSVNEVIRTINRVILQDYGVVITMQNQRNKLIFKLKDIEQYLYGSQPISNFLYIRQCLSQKRAVHLKLIEVSIYDKQQFLRFIFHRDTDDVIRGAYAGFPWQSFNKNNPHQKQFLMWHLPEDQHTHPASSIDMQLLFSVDELKRTTYRIKLKMQQKKRLKTKKMPRFLWKDRINQFLQKRKGELRSRLIEVQSNVIFSGECLGVFRMQITTVNNLFALFKGLQRQNKTPRRKMLQFMLKDAVQQQNESNLPSIRTRTNFFNKLRKQNKLDILPFLMNVVVQFVLGKNILHTMESKFVVADNNQLVLFPVVWQAVSKLPMQINIVLKLQVYSRQGEGGVYGVGAIKLFDEFGFMRQGKHEVQLYSIQNIQYMKIGCIGQNIEIKQEITKIILNFPEYRQQVIWSLADTQCSKMMGFQPPLNQQSNNQIQPSTQKLNELLRYNPLAIYHYTQQQKNMLRRHKKFYKHQSDKLINYLLSIDWIDPLQVQQVYSVLPDWAPLKPIQALFLLIPALPDQKIRYYAVQRMQSFLDYEFVLYSNQITQALVSFETDCNPLIDLILQKCTYEPFSIGQEYFWQFRNRLTQAFTAKRFSLYLQCLLMSSSYRKDFMRQVQINSYLVKMNEQLIADTEQIKNFKDKNSKFQTMLPQVQRNLRLISPLGFNFPVRPQYVFNCLKKQSCKMFDSKKLPFAFTCLPRSPTDPDGSKQLPYKVMFKYGDDIKQDHLVLQLFRVFDKLWKENNLDCRMSIYKTLSTGNQIGFIQIVEGQNNSKIHKDHGKGLVQAFDERCTYLFLEKHNKDNEKMAIAKENFIRSSVGYLVATFVLGIGDRHSGNIMVQKNGKYFHIDFGHILGNFKTKFNIKRQRTPFLFTSQFVYVMGGQQSPAFRERFLNDCAKAFNILRKNATLIINLLVMMVGAQIPQLKKIQDIYYAVDNLFLDLSEQQAGDQLIAIIRDTLDRQKTRKLDNAFHQANRDG